MKRKYIFLNNIITILVLSAITTHGAHAQQLLKPKSGYSTFKLQPFYLHYSYDEYKSDGTHSINDKGPTGGIEFQWQYFFNNSNVIFIPVEANFYGSGNIKYTGALMGEEYGSRVNNNFKFLFFTIRSLAGYSFAITPNHAINLLSGFGYHLTFNARSAPAGYDRVNHQLYLPLAIEYQYQQNNFSVTAHTEYDVFLSGWQYSYFKSQVVPCDDFEKKCIRKVDTDTPIHRQSRGWGVKTFVEVNIDNFLITPFFNYFWVGRSTATQNHTTARRPHLSGAEPENTTIEAGIKAGYRF